MPLEADRNSLICAAQTGDPFALNRLLEVCQPDARRYAYKHCQVSDVDDAVQEALLIVASKLTGLRALPAFSSWLFIVIKRECRRLQRAMFRHDPINAITVEHKLGVRTDQSLRLDLAAALESLPPHYLQVVLLRDFKELTISEIVERLHEPAGAINGRLHRARHLVREYLMP